MIKDNYTLENFEGPLDHLYFLLNKNELDIYQVTLADLIRQFLARYRVESNKDHLDRGAEFISMVATLCWFKSKALLPKHEQIQENLGDFDIDQNFEIIHHLVDYCRFKQAAKDLSERELQQSAFYYRGVDPVSAKKNLGIDHLSLNDLNVLFNQVLAKASIKCGDILEEEWKVSDKIDYLKQLIEKLKTVEFLDVFRPIFSRTELIVIFLALLEMMKAGEVKVIFDKNKDCVYIQKR